MANFLYEIHLHGIKEHNLTTNILSSHISGIEGIGHSTCDRHFQLLKEKINATRRLILPIKSKDFRDALGIRREPNPCTWE